MSHITVTDKTAAAFRARRAAEITAERRAMAASMDDGMDSIRAGFAFIRRHAVEIATGSAAGLLLAVAGMFYGVI